MLKILYKFPPSVDETEKDILVNLELKLATETTPVSFTNNLISLFCMFTPELLLITTGAAKVGLE